MLFREKLSQLKELSLKYLSTCVPQTLPNQTMLGPVELRYDGERHDDLMSSTPLPPVSVNLKGWPLPHLPPPDRWRRLSWPLLDESWAAAAARACGVAKTDPRNNPCYKHGLQRQRRQRESIGILDYHQITSTFYWCPKLVKIDLKIGFKNWTCVVTLLNSKVEIKEI